MSIQTEISILKHIYIVFEVLSAFVRSSGFVPCRLDVDVDVEALREFAAGKKKKAPLHVPARFNMPVQLKSLASYIKLSDYLQAKADVPNG